MASRSVTRASLGALATGCALLASLLLGPQTAFAATTASDNFARANGSLGGNWSDMTDGGMAISSQAAAGTAASGMSGDAWAANAFSSDQFSQVTLTSTQLAGGQWIGASARIQDGGLDNYTGLYYWNNGNPQLMLFVRVTGNWAELGAPVTTPALPAGATLEVTATGSTIALLENGTQVITATDTHWTGGAPGIMAFGTAKTSNWTGGNASGTGGGSGTTYTVGGSVSGLTGSVVLQDNGGDNLTLSSNGSFTFATALAGGAAYNVTVQSSPAGQSCTVASGAGTIASANVTSVTVSCTTTAPAAAAAPAPAPARRPRRIISRGRTGRWAGTGRI